MQTIGDGLCNSGKEKSNFACYTNFYIEWLNSINLSQAFWTSFLVCKTKSCSPKSDTLAESHDFCSKTKAKLIIRFISDETEIGQIDCMDKRKKSFWNSSNVVDPPPSRMNKIFSIDFYRKFNWIDLFMTDIVSKV